jgi:hypothetical protein
MSAISDSRDYIRPDDRTTTDGRRRRRRAYRRPRKRGRT